MSAAFAIAGSWFAVALALGLLFGLAINRVCGRG